ncbi:unnamed protein product [Schistosoma bovis]|nr:unnamed protein product [Schistosoma bovis]
MHICICIFIKEPILQSDQRVVMEAESARSQENEEIKDEENMLNTPKVNDEENIQSERQQFTNSDDKIQHEENELTEITTDTMPIGESVEKNETSTSSSSGKK